MNVWSPKELKAGKDVRVTAGGASKMVIHCTTLLDGTTEATSIETSYDGINFVNVTGWFDSTNDPVYVFIADSVTPRLLGSRIRCGSDALLIQED